MKSSRWRWHLGEMFVEINGERHYLCRAVDREGEVLESFLTKTRDKKAALKFLKRSMKRYGRTYVSVSVYVSVHNHFNLERHLYFRANFKTNRAAALAE